MNTMLNALFTPFRHRNIKSTLVIPGLMIWFLMFILVLSGAITGILLYQGNVQPLHGLLGLLMLLACGPFALVALGLVGVSFLGYQWRMVSVFQASGFQAAAPVWSREEWRRSFVAGLHLVGYCGIFLFVATLFHNFLGIITGYEAQAARLDTPIVGDFQLISYTDPSLIYPELSVSVFWMVLLSILGGVLFTPLFLGPLFYNAQAPALDNLLRNLVPAWKWTFSRYLQVCGVSIIWQFGLGLVMGILILIFGLSLLGLVLVPFVLVAGILLTNSLYVCAFSVPPHCVRVQQEAEPILLPVQ